MAAFLGLPRLAGAHRGAGLIALTYHSVGPAAEHPYLNRMPPERFRAQIRYLKDNYEVVTVADGLDRLASGAVLVDGGRPMVAVTVDDGYGDNYEHIFPILMEESVRATIFLATDYLDSGKLPWPTRISALLHFATARRCPMVEGGKMSSSAPIETVIEKNAANRALKRSLSTLDQPARDAALEALSQALAPEAMNLLAPLTWDQVREMRDAGVSFGAHTRYHAWLDRVSTEERDRELGEAKARIEEETGSSCDVIAYPNGNHDAAVRVATARMGYRYALTQDRGINRAGFDPFAVHRVEIPFDERIGSFVCRAAGFAL